MMMLVEILFVGLVLPFANSNYEYDYDPNSNYNSNATIEDCDDKLSENECFCYDEQEADIPYSICKESVLLSGKSSILRLRFYPGQHSSFDPSSSFSVNLKPQKRLCKIFLKLPKIKAFLTTIKM